MTDLVTIGFRADTSGIVKAKTEMDKLAKSGAITDVEMNKAEKALSGVDKAASKASGGMGRMGRSAGQASIQVQQFIGQVQGGTSASIALSQQAADLGIVLGFPLLGAVTAIAAGFAGPFISSLLGASSSVSELQEKLEKLAETKILTAEQAEFLSMQESKAADELRESIRAIESAIKADEGRIESIQRGTGQTLRGERAKKAVIDRTNDSLIKQRAELALLRGELKDSEDRIKSYDLASKGVIEKTEDEVRAFESVNKSLEAQIIALRDGEKAALEYGIAQSLGLKTAEQIPPEIRAQITELTALTEAKKLAVQVEKERAQALAEARRVEALQNQEQRDLSALIDQVDSFGGAWSRTGNAMVDAFGSAADAIDQYSAKMSSLADMQDKLTAKKLEYAAAGKDTSEIERAQAKISAEMYSTNIGGVTSLLGASKTLFSEQSKGRKAVHALETGFAAVEIALAAEKAAMNAVAAITNQGSGDPYSAFARIATMTGIMAGLLGAAGIAFSGGGGGGYSSPTSGTGSVLGDSTAQSASVAAAADDLLDVQFDQLNELRGIRDSLSSLTNGITSISTMVVRGGAPTVSGLGTSQKFSVGFGGSAIDQLTGGVLSSVVGAIVGGISETKRSVIDQGIQIESQNLGDILSGTLEATYFSTIKTTKKKLWGLSQKSKTSTEFMELDSALSGAMEDIFQSTADVVLESVKSLGVGFLDLSGFAVEFDAISTLNKTGEEIEEEFQAVFSKIGDDLALYALPVIDEYQKLGEGALETLVRVASEQAVFIDSINAIGISLSNLDAEMQIGIGQTIIDLTGGIEQFSELTSDYFSAFFSEAEQFDYLQSTLEETFASLGVELVATRGEFRAIVESLDLTTESGQRTFAALMELSPAMDEYLSQLEEMETERLAIAEQAAEEAEAARLAQAQAAEEARLEMLQKAADAAAEVESSKYDTLLQIMRLNGQESEALAIEREKAIAEASIGVRVYLRALYEAQDLATEQAELQEQLNAATNDLAQAEADLIAARESAISNAYSMVERAIGIERDAAQARLDAAEESRDSELGRIAALRDAIESQYSTLTDNLASREDVLRASFDTEIEQIQTAASERINALNAERSVISSNLSNMSSLANRLLSSVSGNVSSEAALAAARRGDFSLAEQLSTESLGSAGFGSATELAIAEAIRQNQVQQIGNLAAGRASSLERQLTAIDNQTNAIQLAADEQVTALQEQLNGILGVDTSIMSMSEAITAYQSAKQALDELNYDEQLAKFDLLEASANEVYALHEQAYSDQIAELDRIASQAEDQLNALLSIDDTILSVNDALDALYAFTVDTNAPAAIDKQAEAQSRIEELNQQIVTLNTAMSKNAAATTAILKRIESDGLDVRVQ